MNEEQLVQLSNKFREKLLPIKLVLLDVDGILTTGHVFYAGEEVGFNRYFHVADGFGIKLLMNAGVEVGVISGGNSRGLKERIENLGIKYAYLGNEDKRGHYLEIKNKLALDDSEILYMADELFDIPILKRVGFAVSVPHASYEVKSVVDYVTKKEGGHGCVREMIDLVRYAKNIKFNMQDFDDRIKSEDSVSHE